LDGNASTLGGRDTFVGLASPYGTLLYASNIDGPYKRGVQERDPFFATGIGTQKGFLGSPGFNVTSVNAVSGTTVGGNAASAQQQNAGFDARLNNLVTYRSLIYEGFSAELGYGFNEQKSTSAGVQINPDVWSLQGRYVMGPLFASYSFEQRRDVFGLNSLLTLTPGTGITGAAFTLTPGASSRDSGNKVGIGYRFPFGTDVLLVLENLKYTTNVGSVASYDRDAAVVSVAQDFGLHRLVASYSKATDGRCSLASADDCSTASLGAQQLALGYIYSMDKSTWLYVFGSKIFNEAAAAYNFGVSGAPAAGVGADPGAVALGVRYRF
jgi:predicted porin